MAFERLLSNHCFAITRPIHQAQPLVSLINDAGGEALLFPLLEITALESPVALELVSHTLHEYDWAIFVSPNAVEQGLSYVLSHRAWPKALKVAAVGPGSAQALAARGVEHIQVPANGYDSEALLRLSFFDASEIQGCRIVIFRGETGREWLRQHLEARGAQVDYAPCYSRVCRMIDPQPLLERAQAKKLSGMIVTSSEAVNHLASLLGQEGVSICAQVPVFAFHPRIIESARAAGFACTVLTEAGAKGIVETLLSYFSQTR